MLQWAGYHPGMSEQERLLADIAIRARKDADPNWEKSLRAEARQVHGESRWFEKAYDLQNLYRHTAQNPHDPTQEDGVERLHWWYREGEDSRLPLAQRHGVSSSTYQQALVDFSKAVDRFWKNPQYSKRTGRRIGKPRFRRRGERDGFTIKSLTRESPWKIVEGGSRLVIPGQIGSIRLTRNTKVLRRFITKGGKPTTARFTLRGGKWYVSINVQFAPDNPYVADPAQPSRKQKSAGAVGVDLGVNYLATTSDGKFIANPRYLKASDQHLRALMRKLDRQHRAGSPECFDEAGRHKKVRCTWGKDEANPMSRSAQTTSRQITRLHDLISRQRNGYLHQVTKMLAAEYEYVILEDLTVSGMTGRAKPKEDPDNAGHYLPNRRKAKSGLNRAILDSGFGELRRQLEYKTSWYGSQAHFVDRYAPTSKTCSNCGEVKAKLPLSAREYQCDRCGLVMDRDLNAAHNIRALGLTPPMEREPRAPVGGAGKRQATSVESSAEKTQENSSQRGPRGTSHPQARVRAA